MSYRLCSHLKEDGIPCGSPALRGLRFCYFHHREQQYRLAYARDRRQAEVCDWQLPPLHNLRDVQSALQHIADELWSGRLDPERAGPMLYATQQAAHSFRAGSKRPNSGS